MVQTGNEIQGSGPTGNSLNLNSAELGGALQNVATEEMATPSRISMSTLSGQVAQVNSHLFDLHKFSQGLGGSAGDDEGSLLANRLSMFVNAVGGIGETKSSSLENAADFNSAGVIIGLDYRFSDNFVAGLAGGYSHIGSEFQRNINVSGGSVDANVYNLSLFTSYDIENFYVDGSFTYGWSDYDIERGVVIMSNNSASPGGSDRVAKSDPNGKQYSVGLGFGYNYQYDAFTLRPYARLDYYHGNIGSYNETGAFGLNLVVDEQNFESLQSLFGAQLSYASSHSFGVIIPQVNFGWHHEFVDRSRTINARYTADVNNNLLTALTDSPDQDYFTIGTGVSSVLQGGTQLFFNYQALLGYRRVNSHGFTGGVRIEF
jgi:outer membrane lipase/esterase